MEMCEERLRYKFNEREKTWLLFEIKVEFQMGNIEMKMCDRDVGRARKREAEKKEEQRQR